MKLLKQLNEMSESVQDTTKSLAKSAKSVGKLSSSEEKEFFKVILLFLTRDHKWLKDDAQAEIEMMKQYIKDAKLKTADIIHMYWKMPRTGLKKKLDRSAKVDIMNSMGNALNQATIERDKTVGVRESEDVLEEGISKNVLRSYLETAMWSSGDEFDNMDIKDFSKEALNRAKKDLNAFWKKAGKLLDGEDEKQVAHDFWLTRAGHGAGFWDGDYEEEKGKKLTKIAEKFGNLDPYVGDDGKIYF